MEGYELEGGHPVGPGLWRGDSAAALAALALAGSCTQQQFRITALPLQAAPSTSAAAAEQQRAGAERPLLGVDVRNLRADEELRRMFGSRVVEAEEEERGGGAFAGGWVPVVVGWWWTGGWCLSGGRGGGARGGIIMLGWVVEDGRVGW